MKWKLLFHFELDRKKKKFNLTQNHKPKFKIKTIENFFVRLREILLFAERVENFQIISVFFCGALQWLRHSFISHFLPTPKKLLLINFRKGKNFTKEKSAIKFLFANAEHLKLNKKIIFCFCLLESNVNGKVKLSSQLGFSSRLFLLSVRMKSTKITSCFFKSRSFLIYFPVEDVTRARSEKTTTILSIGWNLGLQIIYRINIDGR